MKERVTIGQGETSIIRALASIKEAMEGRLEVKESKTASQAAKAEKEETSA